MTSSTTDGTTCFSCGEESPAGANWCEACGADLDAASTPPRMPCVSCGAEAIEITEDGWCQMCGTKQPAPEDHVVADHGWFAMVSDRGRVHRTNEDAGAVAARPNGVAMVVCDGVSSTDEAHHASQNAARAIIEIIETAATRRLDEAIVDGANAAQDEIKAVTGRDVEEPPSCTMVSAVADVDAETVELHIGWLGDSRAYWLADGNATQLTRDHSWAIEQHALGELTATEIESDPRAGSITRWLGADSHDVTPELTSHRFSLPGMLLVCSDGLWNYAATEHELHDLVRSGPADEPALATAERLVAFANERGGRDNITVAIASLRPHVDPGDTHG